MWTNRLFTDVKANLFGYDFPLGVKADYKTSRLRLDTGTNFTSGAAWDAFDLARQKPAVTAQATYYVPAARRQPRFEGRLRVPARHRQVHDRRPLRVRLRTAISTATSTRFSFVDAGNNGDLGTTWRGSNDRDLRYAGYFAGPLESEQPARR